jgi:hypothetical protein
MTSRKATAGGVLLAVIVALVTVVSSQPAYAAGDDCTIPPFWTTCTTDTVQAATDNYVWFEIDACDGGWLAPSPEWRVVDAGNGVTVSSGKLAKGHTIKKKVTGLFSRYYLRLDAGGPFVWGNLTNEGIGWVEGTRAC